VSSVGGRAPGAAPSVNATLPRAGRGGERSMTHRVKHAAAERH
jgi:hypothetical protein